LDEGSEEAIGVDDVAPALIVRMKSIQ
jgi:hypothetical protein